MVATLVAKRIAGGYGHNILFQNLDLTVAPGDVLGVVGANGAGKSTLLRLLAGVESAHEGVITFAPGDAFVGWLPQEYERVKGETVSQYVERKTGCTAATVALEAASAALAATSDSEDWIGSSGSVDRETIYASALDRWLASGAADLSDRLPAVLADLGIRPDPGVGFGIVGPDSLMTSLSGGQAARVGLAALFLSRFDIVLLDEPTNDLDLEGLEKLETFVRGLRSGVVLVSHDREFLARTVTRVLELDPLQSTNRVFGGGYQAYLDERETVRRQQRAAFEEYAAQRADLSKRARIQREWSDRGVKNAQKKSSDNDKIRRRSSAESSENQAHRARQLEKQGERLKEVREPRKEWQLQFTIGLAPRSSEIIVSSSKALIRQGNFELGPLSIEVHAGDRIGIVGQNGSGKSTLLRLLLGKQLPDEGSVSLGKRVEVGEIDQARTAFAGKDSVIDAFASHISGWSRGDTQTLLAKFGLGSDHVHRQAGNLSPGERTRAGLALLQARGINVLALDEPTNHLDLVAIEQLEQALESYKGTLFLVTHDRRLLEGVRLNRRLKLSAGTVTEI